MVKQYFVYILTNHKNTVLYAGVTKNLIRRVWEHKNSFVSSFTSKYKVNKLVYFEEYQAPYDAITREKQIKSGSRKKKIFLIESLNPNWEDLYEKII